MENTKIIATQSQEYARFRFSELNRDTIDEKHIKELMESMTKNGFFSHSFIKVRRVPNSRALVVVDGQHRLMAAQRLNIPFYFSVVDDISDEQLPDMQIAKKWLPKDYLKHYIAKGNENYKNLDVLSKKYPKVNTMVLVGLLTSAGRKTHDFKNYKAGLLEINFLQLNIGDHYVVVTGHAVLKDHGLRPQTAVFPALQNSPLLDMFDTAGENVVLLKLNNEATQAFLDFYGIHLDEALNVVSEKIELQLI